MESGVKPVPEDDPGPSPEATRAVHRQFLTGVTILTTISNDEPRGLALNALASVSLDPPTILACVARSSSTHKWLFQSDVFAVNVLAADQAGVARQFAASSGSKKFESIAWSRGRHDMPILDGICAYLVAEVEMRVEAYTHTVFVARVLDACAYDRPPLAYLGGRFFDPQGMREIV
jgi:flavin reductase (DIM6/NTAB) family NADH-FMN oxidoreductase RutF